MQKIYDLLCNAQRSWKKTILIMKLTVGLVLFAMFTTHAVNTYSQTVRLNLNLKNVTIVDIFREIERNSEFGFFFKSEEMDIVKRQSIKVSDATIDEVLKKVLDENYSYRIVDKNIVVTKGNPAAQQQGKKVSGKVTDPTGVSLPGVSVVIKGTTTGVVTDADGNFYLTNIPENATLQFSFVGMKMSEVKFNGQATINITMAEENIGLDEVVVVGYGVQKKSDLTGAVASFNSKTLEERPQANIIQSLQGTVAGLNISITGTNAEGSVSTTSIRGNNSITASNKPLIILDGIPFSGSWSEINPNDIQSLEILKDASSAAIYGARGSNGVILITTKKGSKDKMTVSYDGFVSFDEAINIPKLMDGESFWKYKIEALKAANTTPVTPENPEPWMGSITATEERLHKAGLSTDWVNLSIRSGFKQQHNTSFRGSIGKTGYYVSLNYSDNKGISLNDDFTRVGFRLNLDQQLTSWLKFSTNTQFGRYDRGGNGPQFGRAFNMNPLSEPYDENGNLRLSAWEDSSISYAKNPLSQVNEKDTNVSQKLITNNAFDLQIPFIKGLTYRLNTGYTADVQQNQNYQGRNTYEGAAANGILSNSNTNSSDWIVENILSYNREFNKHTLFITGLYSAQSSLSESNSVTGRDFANDVEYFYQVSKAGTLAGTANYIKSNHLSQMLRINYSFDSRYLLTLTTRRDGYSAFGENSKFGLFPSVGLGWNISNEQFFKTLSLSNVLTNFKYRFSWGKNGNEAVSAYITLPNLTGYNYLTDGKKPLFGFYPSKLASPNLGWETTRSINTGFDFGWLSDRIRGTFDIYWSKTTDLLLNRTIPSINGTNSIIQNIGETQNHGMEFQISSLNYKTKKFSWSTDFSISRYKTEIVNVGLYDETGKPSDDLASKWFIGQPVNVNYDYNIIGIWQINDTANPNGKQSAEFQYSIPGYVKYADNSVGNDITPADKQIIGSMIPDFTAGMNNSFKYGNFSLNLFLNSSFGITARNDLLDVGSVSWRQNQLEKVFWTPENPINTYPKNDLNGSVNPLKAGFYEKANFLRLQDVTFLYRIPANVLKRAKIQKLEFYVNIKNLATWTNWSGLDPEFIGEQRAAPKTRSFLIGLRFDL